MLIFDRLEHAMARRARIYAEVLDSGVSNDAHHMIASAPSGGGAALVTSHALAEAGVETEAVDYINAHAASTLLGELTETQAINCSPAQTPRPAPNSDGAPDLPL